jgi:tRNA-Thr(GGU) m(6)t(6)A37 methyltransferase TsaA
MIGIAAQVSLYPLRQEHLAPAIDEALRIFRKHDLDVEAGSMSSVITGDDEAIFAALQEAFRRVAEQGHLVMTVTFSNACAVLATAQDSVTYEPIGYVKNAFDEPGSPATMAAAESRIVLDRVLTAGLSGLEPGQKLLVLYHFHRTQDYDLLQHPQGNVSKPVRGVFALRSPHRPSPIGVTLVELLAIEENVLRVHGLDAINGTPVLDLKPA